MRSMHKGHALVQRWRAQGQSYRPLMVKDKLNDVMSAMTYVCNNQQACMLALLWQHQHV